VLKTALKPVVPIEKPYPVKWVLFSLPSAVFAKSNYAIKSNNSKNNMTTGF